MTTVVEGRRWAYYPNGQYACRCFFCNNQIGTQDQRYYSREPTPIYSCFRCMDAGKVRPPGQEALPTPENTPNPTSREAAIATAHAENMESARLTREVMERIAKAIEDRTAVLKAQLEAKQ